MREQILQVLQWNDRNGCYTDANCDIEELPRLTIVEAIKHFIAVFEDCDYDEKRVADCSPETRYSLEYLIKCHELQPGDFTRIIEGKMLEHKAWMTMLSEYINCYPDYEGNMPCDNGLTCDMCSSNGAQRMYEVIKNDLTMKYTK